MEGRAKLEDSAEIEKYELKAVPFFLWFLFFFIYFLFCFLKKNTVYFKLTETFRAWLCSICASVCPEYQVVRIGPETAPLLSSEAQLPEGCFQDYSQVKPQIKQ